MPRDLVADANENLRRAFVTLADEVSGGKTRQFGQVTAAATGLPNPFFNRVFVFESAPGDELDAAVGWLSDRDVPLLVTAAEYAAGAVRNRRSRFGLTKPSEQPGMALAPLEALPSPDSVADIAEVTDPDGRPDVDAVTSSTFGLSMDVATAADRAALAADDWRVFLGRVDGKPVATGFLLQGGDVAGVYNVGVLEQFRRRGIGEAMTAALLRAGREAGCRVGVLQSSEMGYPLYRQMGFETVVTYHQFEPDR